MRFARISAPISISVILLLLFSSIFSYPNLTETSTFESNIVDSEFGIIGNSSGDFQNTQLLDGTFQNFTEINNGNYYPTYPLFIEEKITSSEINTDSDDDTWTYIPGKLFFNTWSYRKNVTINSNNVFGTDSHINFTILVDITDTDLRDYSQTDGDDIAFYQETTQLNHEIEFFNKSTGELCAWVRIPNLSTSSDTLISMYYGNFTINSKEISNKAWKSDYKGVWHLSDYDFTDSNEKHHDGANYGTVNIDGHIAGGKSFKKSESDYVSILDDDEFSFGDSLSDRPFSLSSWIEPRIDDTSYLMFIGKSHSIANNLEYWFCSDVENRIRGNLFSNGSNGNELRVYSDANVINANGSKYLVHFTYDGSGNHNGLSLYLNGKDISAYSQEVGNYIAMRDTSSNVNLGATYDGLYSRFDGILDESRIIAEELSPSWIATEWYNQNGFSSFLNFDMKESAGAWTHKTKLNVILVGKKSETSSDYGQMRFSLDIPPGSEITSANLTFWMMNNEGSANTIVKRIDEANVGPLEDDKSIPVATGTNLVEYYIDNSNSEWVTINVTNIVQDQVEVANWQSGNHIGMQFSMRSDATIPSNFEDFSNKDEHHAFLNVTYSETASKNVILPLTKGIDDDYWQRDDDWVHHIEEYKIRVNNDPVRGIEYGQFRWSLPIPQGSIIQQATVSVWEVQEKMEYDATIKRINETNVGPLERDDKIPNVSDIHLAYHSFNRSGEHWETTRITDMVQDQVNLPGWRSRYYFGVQFNLPQKWVNDNQLESYENPKNHEAFLNISYIENTSWLSGWNYRKSVFLPQDPSTGLNYIIPIDVYYGGYFQTDLDHGERVFTNSRSQSDFDDIRFTDQEGKTLLNYWLETTFDKENFDYFTNSSVTFGHYPQNYPSAYYFNNRTYCSFQGDLDQNIDKPYLNTYIKFYDHENKTWSDTRFVAQNPLGFTDPHGSPCLWVDNSGYIHVFEGAHGGAYDNKYIQHYVSRKPEDITDWLHIDGESMGSVSATYPHVFYDSNNDVLHLYHREVNASSGLVMVYTNSTDGGYTWSEYQEIMDLNVEGSAARPYFEQGELDPNNQELIHILWKKYNLTYTPYYESIFYAKLNVTSGHLFNASNHDLGIKITSEEENFCRIFDSNSLACASEKVRVDSEGNPYVIWAVMNKTGVSHSTIMFSYWTGSTWSPIQNISTYWRTATNIDFIVHNSHNITAFLGTEKRDLARFSWNGDSWIQEETIIDWVSGYATCWGIIPINYHEDFQFYFGEWDAAGKNFKFVKQYAWGSNGFLKGTIGKHARFWVELDGDLSSSNQLIYIYYGNSSTSSLSQALSPNRTVNMVWGNEESAYKNYQIEWEHQCQTIPTDRSSYILTIYGYSTGETFSVYLWDSISLEWIDSGVDIEESLIWHNISISGLSGVINKKIIWKYVDNIRNPDCDPSDQLFIDYVGIDYSNDVQNEYITSRIDNYDFLWICIIIFYNVVLIGFYRIKRRERGSSLYKNSKSRNLNEFFQENSQGLS
ncbi:MAG: DUF2341 domain-containing protein [Candidatus Hodarchaeales archaeon]|jgi:hypothetical protein